MVKHDFYGEPLHDSKDYTYDDRGGWEPMPRLKPGQPTTYPDDPSQTENQAMSNEKGELVHYNEQQPAVHSGLLVGSTPKEFIAAATAIGKQLREEGED